MRNDLLLYGVHPVLEALDTGKIIEKVMVQRGLNPETLQKLLPKLKRAEIPFQFVPKAKLDRVTGKNHQGVIGFISPVEFQDLEWLVPSIYERGEVPFILILDRITDVRNFGAICRSAECAGVHAVVIPLKGAAQINEDAIKTSAGAILRIPVCRAASLQQVVEYLNESGLDTVACTEKGKDVYFETDLNGPLALIMGSEEDGISRNIMEAVHKSVSIPMPGKTESLNVSVATGILLFESLRQRKLPSISG